MIDHFVPLIVASQPIDQCSSVNDEWNLTDPSHQCRTSAPDGFIRKTFEKDVIGTSEYTSRVNKIDRRRHVDIHSQRTMTLSIHIAFCLHSHLTSATRSDNKYTANSSIWSSLLCHPALDSVHSFFFLSLSLFVQISFCCCCIDLCAVYNLMGLMQKRSNDQQLCVYKVSDVITKRKEDREGENLHRSARPAFSLSV